MDYRSSAREILSAIGGKKIWSVPHTVPQD